MSSSMRYTFFTEYLDNVKYSFTPRYLREINGPGNFFFKKPICRCKTHLFTPFLSLAKGCSLILYPLRRIFQAKY